MSDEPHPRGSGQSRVAIFRGTGRAKTSHASVIGVVVIVDPWANPQHAANNNYGTYCNRRL